MSEDKDERKTKDSKAINLPPRLPRNEQELNLTIRLLGNRKQYELGIRAQRRLINLIGVYPTVEAAGLWKRVLRRVYKESLQTENALKDPEKP